MASNAPIPSLVAVSSRTTAFDIRVVFGEAPPWGPSLHRVRFRHPDKDDLGASLLELHESDAGQVMLRLSDGVSFFLDPKGKAIWVTWPSSLSREYTLPYLVASILGFYLRLQGQLCLHASTVVTSNGSALVFTGPGGAGKSTLAAAFASQGYRVLTDDVACIVARAENFLVQPGYPSLRLDDRSAELVGKQPTALASMGEGWEKRLFDLEKEAAWSMDGAVPVGAICFLKARTRMDAPASVRRMKGREALQTLVANTLGSKLLDVHMRAAEFEQLGALARRVPVFELSLNETGSGLRDSCEYITRHVA